MVEHTAPPVCPPCLSFLDLVVCRVSLSDSRSAISRGEHHRRGPISARHHTGRTTSPTGETARPHHYAARTVWKRAPPPHRANGENGPSWIKDSQSRGNLCCKIGRENSHPKLGQKCERSNKPLVCIKKIQENQEKCRKKQKKTGNSRNHQENHAKSRKIKRNPGQSREIQENQEKSRKMQ